MFLFRNHRQTTQAYYLRSHKAPLDREQFARLNYRASEEMIFAILRGVGISIFLFQKSKF